MFSDRDYYRRQPSYQRGWHFSAVTTLILINCACFLLSSINPHILDRTALVGLVPGQVWRLVTYQFFHASFGHIFWNMYGLWLFGSMLERVLGKTRIYVLYLFSGVIGGLCFLLANWGSRAGCVGASGSEFGLMVAAAVAFPKADFFLIFPPVRLRLWVLAAIWCGLEVVYQLGGAQGGVAHLAHLGGALGGLLFMKRLLDASRRNGGARSNFWQRRPQPPRPEPEPTYDPSAPFVFDQTELNRILDKMSRQGYDQLTSAEKMTLKRAADELKKRREE